MSVVLEIGEDEAGSRLDVLLVRRVDGMSRARARRMIQEGSVRVNGRRVRKGARLTAGDAVELSRLPPPRDFVPAPNPDLPLVVLHEDRRLVVVDKPGRQPCHPLREHERHTLANALLARFPEMAGVGYALREPGLVHRLDNDTSGCLLAARDAAAFEVLRAALAGGAMRKSYLALVEGPYEGPAVIDLPLAPHPSDPRRMHRVAPGTPHARSARTEVRPLRRVGAYVLLEVSAPRATRHQVRVHLACVGHPLVGDWLYGGTGATGLPRHFLHASTLAFAHPEGGTVDVRAPLPGELAALAGAG